ncbi:zinc dependent phospholipase C family protein [Ornithinibacillus xuwenensis]|uniref:Zinc dependent phospholipase C family protein n=1 Tax=Ornithinibacillus xuwenensis TaxID=3144668 RepID=A0ABU9XHU1_9BACI
MGSRIMHLIIAKQIAEQFSIQDKNAFLLGGIAPDAVSPKEKSHYFEGDTERYTRTIAYEKFIHNYHQKSDYVLGYYTHLIADYVWLKGFYLGWLKNRMNADNNLYEKYHQDFRLLNGKLLHHYQISKDILENVNFNTIHDLDEVKVRDVVGFVPYVKGDFNYKKETLNDSLQVFSFQQIIGYLETSIEIGLMRMKEAGIT